MNAVTRQSLSQADVSWKEDVPETFVQRKTFVDEL